jgi:ATP-dependent Clp protease ATP-binding subunit ClpB
LNVNSNIFIKYNLLYKYWHFIVNNYKKYDLFSYYEEMAFFDSYDESAKGIVSTTYDLASKHHHNPVDIPHLFFVLMNQSNHEIADLIRKWGASMDMVKVLTKQSLAGLLSIDAQFSISKELNDIFVEANTIAKNMHDIQTSPYHIFLAFLKSKSQITEQLQKQGISYEKMEVLIKSMSKSRLQTQQNIAPEQVYSWAESLSKFSEDLTQLARDGKLKQVIWRDKELEQMIEVLCRKEKNNIIILGESGVGKTALAEFLAQKIVVGEVPAYLHDKQILRINLGSLLAGTKFRGEFEDKINHLIKTVKESQGKILLFIDEFHNVAGAGKSEWSMDLSEMLKPELSSGNIQIIGATTTSEFRKNVEKDTWLTRRFETITLQEPTVQDTITILRGIEHSFESYHGVIILDSALVAAAELSDKYIKERKLPDKAISLVDQAATKVKISITSFPGVLTDLKQQAWKLNKERHSLLDEIENSSDEVNKQRWKIRIDAIDTELNTMETQYMQKKTDWETMKALFWELLFSTNKLMSYKNSQRRMNLLEN